MSFLFGVAVGAALVYFKEPLIEGIKKLKEKFDGR